MNPELLMSLTAGKALSLDHIPGGARPEWTPEDAAHACQGLDMRRYVAFAYRWAHDESLYSSLYGCLMAEASLLAYNENWPHRLRDSRKYLDSIVRIAIFEEWNTMSVVWSRLSKGERQALINEVPEGIRQLIEDGQPEKFRPFVLAKLAQVSVDVWRVELERRYEGIRQILDGWCHDAHAHVMRKIRDVA